MVSITDRRKRSLGILCLHIPDGYILQQTFFKSITCRRTFRNMSTSQKLMRVCQYSHLLT